MRMHRIAALVALSLAVVSCVPSGGSDAASSGDTVTLNVWSWQQDQTSGWKTVLAAFEEDHPKIKVNFRGVTPTEYDTILKTGMSGADGPDVPFLRSYGLMQYLVDGKNLVRLDTKLPSMAAWPAATLDGARSVKNKGVYGVPFAMQTIQVFYNKKLFADNGLAVPTTWDEFVAAADKFKAKGIVPLAGSVKDAWTLPINLTIFGASRYGGPSFEKDLLSGKSDFTNPNYVAAIAHLKDVVGQYFPKDAAGVTYADSQTLFASGKAAMHPGGSWEIGDFKKSNPDLDFGVFSVPAPPGSLDSQTLTGGYVDGSIGMNAKTKHPKEALELLRWFTTKQFGDLFMSELAQPSVVPGAEAKDPILNQALDNYRRNPTPYLEYADFGYGTPDGWTLATQELQKVLVGKQQPLQAADAINKGVAQWFKPTQ
jgi:raffinose/stachyose/melibiose transport system substrate-binding protein